MREEPIERKEEKRREEQIHLPNKDLAANEIQSRERTMKKQQENNKAENA